MSSKLHEGRDLPACSPVPRTVSGNSLNRYVLNEWTRMTVAIQVASGEINVEERSAVAYSSLRQVRQC